MANLPEIEDFADGTYQIETSDRVLGGPGGIANKQAEQLGNRTAWLRAAIAKVIDGTTAVGKATQLAASRTLKFKGAVNGSGSYDGTGDTEIALTLVDTGVAAGTYTKVTINVKGLVTGASNPTTLSGYGITDALTSSQVNTALSAKADKASTLGGYGITDAFTKPETTSAIQQAISSLVASSSAALDTLNELAAALGNDPNFATTMTNALAGKAAKATTLGGYGIELATQVEAQAQSDQDNTKPMTALRVWQAIVARVTQATEAAFGWAKVATQGQLNAGTDDATFVTPKKLRAGFSISLAANGYVMFPTWLGGLIFQWGWANVGDDAIVAVPLPMAFPSTFFAAFATPQSPNAVTGAGNLSATAHRTNLSTISVGMNVGTGSGFTVAGVSWWALGV